MCADSSTETKRSERRRNIVMCHVSCVLCLCHVSHVTCHLSSVTCHQSPATCQCYLTTTLCRFSCYEYTRRFGDTAAWGLVINREKIQTNSVKYIFSSSSVLIWVIQGRTSLTSSLYPSPIKSYTEGMTTTNNNRQQTDITNYRLWIGRVANSVKSMFCIFQGLHPC